MINYGFAINAEGNAINVMNGIGTGAANLEHKIQKHTSDIGHHFKSMFSEIKGMAALSVVKNARLLNYLK